MKTHQYNAQITWTGNNGEGTSGYKSYERQHRISVTGKPDIGASSDPSFRGNPALYNPEELLVASLSSCHMLWYLHFCSTHGVIVTEYIDNASGEMVESADGNGSFRSVTLRPVVTITDEASKEKAQQLHDAAHKYCFIANSVNFDVTHQPTVIVAS